MSGLVNLATFARKMTKASKDYDKITKVAEEHDLQQKIVNYLALDIMQVASLGNDGIKFKFEAKDSLLVLEFLQQEGFEVSVSVFGEVADFEVSW